MKSWTIGAAVVLVGVLGCGGGGKDNPTSVSPPGDEVVVRTGPHGEELMTQTETDDGVVLEEYHYYFDSTTGQRVKHGQYSSFYYSGDMKAAGVYQLGKEEGLWIYWDRDGFREEITFRQGMRHGSYVLYDEEGRKREELTYQNGLREGVFVAYDDQGGKTEEGAYRADMPDGRWNWYSPGQIVTGGVYKDGKEDGEWTYYEDGQVYGGSYQAGVKCVIR